MTPYLYISQESNLVPMSQNRGVQEESSRLTNVDQNPKGEVKAVACIFIDWRHSLQFHALGVRSFINNCVRPSLIPLLISYFENACSLAWDDCYKFADELSTLDIINLLTVFKVSDIPTHGQVIPKSEVTENILKTSTSGPGNTK